jgi:hypothetical protein
MNYATPLPKLAERREDPQIICPTCQTGIRLTESLAAPLIAQTRRQYEEKLARRELEFARRETLLQQQQSDLAKARQSIDDEVSMRLKAERSRIATEETAKARLAFEGDLQQKDKDLSDLKGLLEERNAKLTEARQAQAELLRKQRELDDARREMELTIEKRVQESLGQIREKARHEAEDSLRLRLAEKEEQISSMQRQIEDLKRKAEQGSQQLQGEVLELELEHLLRSRFPRDVIEPVPKGEFGGDVLHRVMGPLEQVSGAILWESKRTKNWSDGWLPKLRDDQRAAGADLAILVTQAVPKGLEGFDCIDGVWVTESRCAMPVALALRQSLVELAAARQAREGQQTKMELVYQYLTGPRFRRRVEAIVERFVDMQADLDRERRAMTRSWARREEQIRGVIESTAGMYGDLQGIAGRSLQEIDSLQLQLPAGDAPDRDART